MQFYNSFKTLIVIFLWFITWCETLSKSVQVLYDEFIRANVIIFNPSQLYLMTMRCIERLIYNEKKTGTAAYSNHLAKFLLHFTLF